MTPQLQLVLDTVSMQKALHNADQLRDYWDILAFVVGSYLLKAKDPINNASQLRSLLAGYE
jgi:3-keto-L-gulonate-6-phosphate decarboxylase